MSSPCRRRRLFTPVGALEGEASFWLPRPKKMSTEIVIEKVFQRGEKVFIGLPQKRSTKIALGTGISPEKQNFHLKFGKKKFAPQSKSPGDAYGVGGSEERDITCEERGYCRVFGSVRNIVDVNEPEEWC